MNAGDKANTRVFDKMLGTEMRLLNQNIVTRRKSLKELLSEEKPSIPNKSGETYFFDKDALKNAASKYPDYRHADILLPIHFYVDLEVPNQCFVRVECEADFLKKVAGLEGYPFRKGKMWLSKAIAGKLIKNILLFSSISISQTLHPDKRHGKMPLCPLRHFIEPEADTPGGLLFSDFPLFPAAFLALQTLPFAC
jgi:uncharacterized protein (UPF0216 family)